MSKLAEIIGKNEDQIRKDWLAGMTKSVQRADLMSKAEVEEQSRTLLGAITHGTKSDESVELKGPAWESAKDLLQQMSASRARQGFTPAERSEEHTSELQSRRDLVCRLLLEKKK